MNDLQNISYDKLTKIYAKYFSLGYLGKDISDKFACISLTCYITKELQKKGKNVNCFDVLKIVAKDFNTTIQETFLKPLGAMCEDFMYGCEDFPTFGLESKEIPKTLKNILDKFLPF